MNTPDRNPEWRVGTLIDVGLVVREARRLRQWTQAELAQRAHVSRRWIVALESGQAARAEFGRVLSVLSALDLRMRWSLRDANSSPASTSPPENTGLDHTAVSEEPQFDLDAYLKTFIRPSPVSTTRLGPNQKPSASSPPQAGHS